MNESSNIKQKMTPSIHKKFLIQKNEKNLFLTKQKTSQHIQKTNKK
jgi:hypothetical protein